MVPSEYEMAIAWPLGATPRSVNFARHLRVEARTLPEFRSKRRAFDWIRSPATTRFPPGTFLATVIFPRLSRESQLSTFWIFERSSCHNWTTPATSDFEFGMR